MIHAQAQAPATETRINIVQGQFRVTCDPGTVLTTLLGSCVAACLTDRQTGVGGMNHFLLPGDDRDGTRARHNDAIGHGVHAMELLVNGLLQLGARRDRLEAKLFGGARILDGLTDVGSLNADFAERFIRRERIMLVGGSLRGDRGRRVQFWPASGRARQIAIGMDDTVLVASERQRPRLPVLQDSGAVELF